MSTTTLHIKDMHCSACHHKIRQSLDALTGITSMQFNPVRRQVTVTHADGVTPAELLLQIETSGFQPTLLNQTGQTSPGDRQMLKRLGVAGLAMMQVMMLQIALYAGAFQGIQAELARLLEYAAMIFCIPVVSYCAVPFFRQATRGWPRHLSINMDTPIALAITIAFSASVFNTWRGAGDTYYDSVAMFTFLMLGARYIDQRLRGRLQLQNSLTAALPREVLRLQAGRKVPVDLNAVQAGDLLWIDQGAQIPTDGNIWEQATALLDEALLSGESAWVERHGGARVYAGTFNRGSGFTLRVTALPQDSRLAAIDRLADQALASKNGLARLADKVARVFIPAILAMATLTCAGWLWVAPEQALSATLAVLVVSCPCALSLATPAALTAGLIKLRQLGVMVKNPRALEVDHLQQVFIDKTGTLTRPDPTISNIQALGNLTEADCLHYAAALQAYATHPLANAFKHLHQEPLPELQDVTVHPEGVYGRLPQAEGGTALRVGSADFCGINPTADNSTPPQTLLNHKAVYLAAEGQPLARFNLHNPLREDAEAFVQGCRARQLEVTIVSGDTDSQCQQASAQLGLQAISRSQPEDKTATLRAAKVSADNGATLYVGDGLNDLPALATADVSIAMLETSDLVKSKADVNLLSPRLTAILEFVDVSRRCRQIIRQNLFWAFTYNLAAIPLAAFGFAPPWVAALGMSSSSLLVMLNACRMLGTVPLTNSPELNNVPASGQPQTGAG
ncbi:MAG: cation-translocating P-type ATPase [Pseudomonadota bacterium]